MPPSGTRSSSKSSGAGRDSSRGLAAGVTAGVGEGSRRIAESALDGFKRGGIVKKPGNFKRKKK